MSLGTDYIIRYLSDISGAVQGAKDLEAINKNTAKNIQDQYGEMSKVIRTLQPVSKTSVIKVDGKEAIQTITTTGQVLETLNGKFIQVSKTTATVGNDSKVLSTNFKELSKEAANGNDVFANWANSIKQLASRAVLTIPIWLALRAAVTGIMSGISGGFGSMIELDKALNKARVAAGGTIEEMKKEMATLKPFMEKLAVETGQSIKDLGDVFFSFRATGLDFQTSMAGMEVSNKIARTQMGDVKKVAESLAKVMLLMGDSFESGGSSIDKMNRFAALSYELNTKNAFSIDQLTDSMLTFAPSAKTAGLSAEQALKLMATVNSAAIMGTAAGRTMGTGLSKFITNFKELTPLLGIKIDPKVGTFNALMQTLDALKRLNVEGKLSPEFTKAINDLFGGERGGKTVKALVSVYDLLKQNVGLTGDINKMNDALQLVNDSISVQAERFNQLRDASWRSFMVGILGGENFQKSLKEINSTLEVSKGVFQGIGLGLNWTGKIINDMALIPGLINAFTNAYDAGTKKNIANTELLTEATRGLKGELDPDKLQAVFDKLVDLKSKGKLTIGDAAYQELAAQLQTKLDEITSDNPIGIKAKVTEVDTSEVSKTLQAGSEQEKTAKLILQNSIEQLKTEGATTSQILKATQLRSDQLKLYEDGNTKLGRQLELERAINDEKRLQSKLSSDTMKLFDIAKTEGVSVAKAIGDVLAGNTSFETFNQIGGKNLEVFKTQFADLFKQQQALEFFKGNTVAGEPGLTGGFGINIQENAIRKPISQFDVNTAIAQQKADSFLQRIANVTTTAPVTVNANIDISKLAETKEQFIKEVTRQLPQAGTDVNNALVQALAGKQGNSL